MITTCCILIVTLINVIYSLEGDIILKELGEKQYLAIKEKSNLPVHGTCWHDALRTLKNRCNNLNDHQHSILALRLSNCFLEDSGHPTYDCYLSESDSIRRKCIHQMSDRAFGVYNKFYTHTTHICFYFNHELWQSETERTIQNLHAASEKMTVKLIQNAEIQETLLEKQKEGLKIQNNLLEHGKQLGNVIKTSADSVHSMVTDFKESSKDQQVLLFEIFSYIRTFQDWMISEVSWFQSIMYYTIACIICTLFSSSQKTADTRITLFTILSINVILERMLVQYNLNTSPDNKIELLYYTWYLRKMVLILCASILIYSYCFYKDQHFENSIVLKRIEQKLNVLQETSQPFKYQTRLAVKKLNQTKLKEK